MFGPKIKRVRITKKLYRLIPKTCRHIGAVKIETREVGGCPNIFSIGGSVERAIAAKVSMMRFIHRS